jgi:sulfoxide reductase catalytic subunit YedY
VYTYSVKSIRRIRYLTERPVNFWQDANAREYGFWANVNPAVNHPRWSQATERFLTTNTFGRTRATMLYNGYEKEVAYLYEGMEETEELFK